MNNQFPFDVNSNSICDLSRLAERIALAEGASSHRAPMEVQSKSANQSAETLCHVCAAAVPSIRRLLHPEPDASESGAPKPIFLSRVREIQDTKDTCVLCRLVDHALTQSWPEVPLWSKASVSMFSPLLDTRAVLVDAEPVTDYWKGDLTKDAPRCLHVEVVLDGARPLAADVGPSGGVTNARNIAGFKIGGRERSFQPEIRFLQQTEDGAKQEKKDIGLAREIGHVCPSDRLRGWYRGCVDNSSHDESCAATKIVSDEAFDTPSGQPIPPPRLPHGTRLIDVNAMKLIPAGNMHDIEYAALSYVWGNRHIQGLHTTRGNVDERQVDGSLSKAPLPKTISDALELARDLGIPYLWVDSLCIVQDADAEKEVQIEAMDKVYGLASLVIVAAAGGDSDAGLVGFRTTPRPAVSSGKEKDQGQFTAHIQDLRLAVSPPPLQHILAASTWHTRGWTYQEWRFARRALIFTSTQVYFLCGAISFSEDLVLESGPAVKDVWQMVTQRGPAATERHSVPGMELHRKTVGVSSGWVEYVDAVESFSPRVVRDPKDILKALAGILGNLHRATRNRFVAGVSVGLLHDALLWVPVVGHLEGQRGERADLSVTGSKNAHGWRTGGGWLPSWSWAGWDGAVNYGVIPPGDSLVKEFKVVFAEPATGSSYKQRPDSDEDEQAGAQPAVHAYLLGHPLTEPQTDRPIPGIVHFAAHPKLHGDKPPDGAEAEAKRAGKPLSIVQAFTSAVISSSPQEDVLSGQLLPPIYSHWCALCFRTTTATLQIAPVLDDPLARADGILDLDGRYIGVALLDQPAVGLARSLRGFYNVDVVALSLSMWPTEHVKQRAFSKLAGVVEGEAPEWIGLLVVREVGLRKEEGEQGGGQSGDEKKIARSFIRIGVAQVVRKAWETWVEKRSEDVVLR